MLSKLKCLKDDMKKNEWIISSFAFNYNGLNYIVLVCLFLDIKEKINEYASVKLVFFKYDNDIIIDNLSCEANSKMIFIDIRTFRQFFNVRYDRTKTPLAIINYFTSLLGQAIPEKVSENVPQLQKRVMVSYLSKCDSEDSNKIYCIGVKRNNKGIRSEYNSNKTRILRKDLFEYFKSDNRISFCYSIDEEKENSDSIIIKNFMDNNGVW